MQREGAPATKVLDHPDQDQQNLLVAADRCDRCGARACVRLAFNEGDLLLCAHHYNTHEDALRDQAISIDDQRHLIDQRPGNT